MAACNASDIIARLERFYPIRFGTAPPTCNIAQGYAKVGNFFARMAGSQHQVQAIQLAPNVSNLIDTAVAPQWKVMRF